ncbi:MAG: hypothetical protein MUC51_17830, partial [Anaerolineae bacterium]|nr:hypothetical protein [Anaerolineae bacterium]
MAESPDEVRADLTPDTTPDKSLRQTGRELRAWLRTERAVIWLLVGILLVAAFLRLTNLSWDMNTHIHPDERFLTMVSDAMKLPKS